ncbi:MAG TPA: 1,6-anhydro-N-acetylmuramyl-L-alanine amidase AmpD [Rhodocyclaceae bacterium]|nr:1,6-anhydro-N-acetylmuramyl-L-alanine amidase AmpD [Rhodocyclaceae bacterium]
MASPGPRLTADGLLPGARFVPSPNQDARPAGDTISLVVVHAISLPPGEFGGVDVERFFANHLDAAAHPYYESIRDLRVSAHFFIRRRGDVVQFVPTAARAWHAGVSAWRGRERCNDFSIGIELEGSDDQAFTPIQYIRLARLIRALRRTYRIEDVVGHADIAPQRKTDPGPLFDWARLRKLLRR